MIFRRFFRSAPHRKINSNNSTITDLIGYYCFGTLAEAPPWAPLITLLLLPILKVYAFIVIIPMLGIVCIRWAVHHSYNNFLFGH